MKKTALTFVVLVGLAGIATAQGQPDDSLADLRAKAAAGDPDAQTQLGIAYEEGRGVPQDEWEAAKWYRPAAAQGHVEAQNRLGVLYARGRGVNKDHAEAVTWYRKAARFGHSAAMFNVGAAYYNGEGVGINDTLAAVWMMLAEEAGDSSAAAAVERMRAEYTPGRLIDAQMRIAEMYEKGEELLPDLARAAKWYAAAAEKGSAEAQFRLALMYRDGRGVERNLAEAAKWRAAAAQQDHAPAVFYMAAAFEVGEGIAPDLASAAVWYERAARRGHLLAMERLGNMYAQGRGVNADDARAYAWFLWATVNGRRIAGFQELQARLTAGDFVKAEKLLYDMNPIWSRMAYTQLGSSECRTRPLDTSLWKNETKRLVVAHVTAAESGEVKDIVLLRASGDRRFDDAFVEQARALKFLPRPGCGDLQISLILAPPPKRR